MKKCLINRFPAFSFQPLSERHFHKKECCSRTGKQLITETLCAQAYIPKFKGNRQEGWGVALCLPPSAQIQYSPCGFPRSKSSKPERVLFVSVCEVYSWTYGEFSKLYSH